MRQRWFTRASAPGRPALRAGLTRTALFNWAYAELSDDALAAVNHADSIVRRGRAVALTLLVATQRPTQKAMGSGAIRSPDGSLGVPADPGTPGR